MKGDRIIRVHDTLKSTYFGKNYFGLSRRIHFTKACICSATNS
jgi:hypothetical protein